MRKFMNGQFQHLALHNWLLGLIGVLLCGWSIGCSSETSVPASKIGPPPVQKLWLDEFPGLLGHVQSSKSEFEETVRMREFVASRINYGADSIRIDAQNPNWYRNSCATMYVEYENHRSTGNMLTAATMLRRLYTDFGYEAYDYDMGVVGQERHAVCLVKIQHYGKQRLIIQDPTFNQTYTDSLGHPYDFFDLIEVLKKREFSNLERRFSTFNPVPGTLQKDNVVRPGPWNSPDNWKLEESHNSTYPFRLVAPRDWEHYTTFRKEAFGPLLVANGYPEDYIYLLFFPINVYGDLPTTELMGQIQVAVKTE